MEFEWDEEKRSSNIAKHGLDFVRAAELFAGDHLTEPARPGADGEPRFLAIGTVAGRHATAVFTVRGDAIRIISLRRARRGERQRHQALFGG